ncbi:MAG TPA: phosphate ABC transporter substrate-binding protein PstS [Acidimicrobiia bacterium]
MRRSFARVIALTLAALVLPVTMIAGSATAASAKGGTIKLRSATLYGSGSTFQLGFDQLVISEFRKIQKAVTINYAGGGSGKGRQDFTDQVADFAGTDGLFKATDPAPKGGLYFYFPTVAAPITVSYNLSGVKKLQLSAETIAKIFSAQITTWDDPTIKADNPAAKLPSTTITVAHRSDSSGTTQNFTSFLVKAAGPAWTLGTGSTVQWPANTQGASGNTGVAKIVQDTDGAIGYVDFSDANALRLTFAAIKNASGKFVVPTIAAASAALAGTTINANLSYDPINAAGAKAYPITSPTWVLVYQNQTDKAKGAAIVAFLNFIYADGQKLATTIDYAPLPKALLKQAKAQVAKIVVPA